MSSTDGLYLRCDVFNTETAGKERRSQSQVEAKPIQQSSSSIEMFQTYLKGVYSVKQLPVDEKYPIDCVKHFVNLECADVRKRKTKKEAEEFRSRIVRGDIGSIQKDSITMEQVAAKQNDSYPKLVLLKGAPGVGKTTFSWELCRRWSAGELLNDYSLVVLLRLRDENVQEAKSLADLFQCGDDSLSTKCNVVDELGDTHGKGVLFILEGLDELPGKLREDKNSVFMKLITGHLLPASTVMVTTRPWAVKDLPDTCKSRIDQHIEILGFTKPQIDEYVDHMIKDGVPEGLRTYISANPHISSAMYNPLHAHIVVEVYRECSEENGSIFPNTTTELYTAYSTIIIHRYLTDHPAAQQWNGDLSALPPSIEPHFNNLCRVAYEGITKKKQQLVFSKADIPDGNATLGFMNSVQPLHRTVARATSPSYNFIHFTLQEYLAAVYIWKNHTPEQHVILFKTEASNGTYKMVLIFLAGLTKFKDEYARCVIPIPLLEASPLSELSGSLMKTIEYSEEHILWLYESQNVNIFHEGEISVFFFSHYQPPQYYFALGYCIASSKSFLKITIDTYVYRCVDWKMLVAGAKKCSSSTAKLKHLTVKLSDDVDPEVLTLIFDEFFKHISPDVERFTLSSVAYELPESLLDLLCSCHNLKEVELGQLGLYVEQECMATLFKILGSNPCLETLTFELATTEDLEILPVLVASSSSLKTLALVIRKDKFTAATIGFSCHKLVQHHELNLLEKEFLESDLVDEDIMHMLTQDITVKIASILRHFPHSLEVLNLDQFMLDSHVLHELANTITACSSLKELHVSILPDPNFERDKSGFQAMAKALKSIQTLHVTGYSRYLYILLSRLHHHSSIRNLVIKEAAIRKQEAIILAGLLRINTSLQVIDIHTNVEVDESDFVLIVDALRSNSYLKQLRVDDGSNGLGFLAREVSPRSIASMLEVNRTLEVLDISSFRTERLISKAIAKVLCMNTTLKILKLHNPWGNSPFANIGDDDITAFGKMLTKNKSLQVLHLELDPTEHVQSLMKGLAVNKTLQELVLPDDIKDTVIRCPEYVTNIHRIRFLSRYDDDDEYYN